MDITQNKQYPWILVACYSLLGVCFPAAITQFSMVIETLSKVMHVSEQTILLADSFRAVCLVISMFMSGLVYRKFGAKTTIILGVFFQIVPQFLIPFAVQSQSIALLYLLKGMQGLNAVSFPVSLSTITAWIDSRYKGLATAVYNGSFNAGAGIGAWISGRIIPIWGWQASSYFWGGICLIFLIPALLITKEKPAQDSVSQTQVSKETGQYGFISKSPTTWVLVISLLAYTWISQVIIVDMPIYSNSLGYSYAETGNLMLIISLVTIIASIAAGGISDLFAVRAANKIKSRTTILALGYIVSAAASVLLPVVADKDFAFIALTGAAMMIGVAWVQGGFWAIPSEIYSAQENVVAISICTGASNIVNPIAPMVVGVLLGTRGLWSIGWITCALMAVISIIAAILLPVVNEKAGVLHQ